MVNRNPHGNLNYTNGINVQSNLKKNKKTIETVVSMVRFYMGVYGPHRPRKTMVADLSASMVMHRPVLESFPYSASMVSLAMGTYLWSLGLQVSLSVAVAVSSHGYQ